MTYDGRSRPSEIVLNFLPIWVRIYDLPQAMMTKAIGQTIGSWLGKVRKAHVDLRGQAWDDFMRIRVEYPMHKPLMCWLKIEDKTRGQIMKFDLKYEGVPRFCFYCRCIGHIERGLYASKGKVDSTFWIRSMGFSV